MATKQQFNSFGEVIIPSNNVSRDNSEEKRKSKADKIKRLVKKAKHE
jgi:hypothetical protein